MDCVGSILRPWHGNVTAGDKSQAGGACCHIGLRPKPVWKGTNGEGKSSNVTKRLRNHELFGNLHFAIVFLTVIVYT